MSIAFVAPSAPRRSSVAPSTSTCSNVPDDIKPLNRSQTFACCPPATGIRRSNTSITTTTTSASASTSTTTTTTTDTTTTTLGKPTRAPTSFGRILRSPQRTRTGIVHIEPRPAKNGLIISGYTCIGKTSFGRKISLKNKRFLHVVDLDSSTIPKGDNFVEEYLAAIRRVANERTIVLISTHDPVAARLKEEGYYVALVYPEGSPENKREWLRRLENREVGGRKSRLYKFFDENWDLFDQHMRNCPASKKVALSNTGYLMTVFNKIYQDYFQQVVIH